MAQTVSSRLGLEVIVVDAGNESEIDKALASAVQHGADAVYSGSDAFINSHEACRMKWQDRSCRRLCAVETTFCLQKARLRLPNLVIWMLSSS
jgi:hypothetical protein